MSKIINLTQETHDEVIKEGTVLLDFWAPWCGPCRMISPVLEQLSEEVNEGTKVCKINVDEEQVLAQKYGIRSIPTLIFIKDGEIKEQIVGVQEKDALKEKLETL